VEIPIAICVLSLRLFARFYSSILAYSFNKPSNFWRCVKTFLGLHIYSAQSNYDLLERINCALNRQESLSHLLVMSCAWSCVPHFARHLVVYDTISRCKLWKLYKQRFCWLDISKYCLFQWAFLWTMWLNYRDWTPHCWDKLWNMAINLANLQIVLHLHLLKSAKSML
jgi:hypothetical protein